MLRIKSNSFKNLKKKCLSDDEQGWNKWFKIYTANMSKTEKKLKCRVKSTSLLNNSGEYLQPETIDSNNKRNWQGGDMQIK